MAMAGTARHAVENVSLQRSSNSHIYERYTCNNWITHDRADGKETQKYSASYTKQAGKYIPSKFTCNNF